LSFTTAKINTIKAIKVTNKYLICKSFSYKILQAEPPNSSPKISPKKGIKVCFQSEFPLPLMGRKKCANLDPKSLAGLLVNPVVPPIENPITMINAPTTRGFNPSVNLHVFYIFSVSR